MNFVPLYQINKPEQHIHSANAVEFRLMQGAAGPRAGSESDSRAILASAGLMPQHLIAPVFVAGAKATAFGANSMPGVKICSLDEVASHAGSLLDAGISSIILFGIPLMRTPTGSNASQSDGVVQTAIRLIRSLLGRSIEIITDVCVCQYSDCGHCGLEMHQPSSNPSGNMRAALRRDNLPRIDNDATLRVLSEIALSHAVAGADVVAPSSMMDGQVWAIREKLRENGLKTKILSYSAKHASSLYAPFRSATFAPKAGSLSTGLDKASYQVSYATPRQVVREVLTDIEEGADMVMIKPALCYLDLVARAKEISSVPLVVQNVSGEYSMIMAAADAELIDEEEWKVISIASMKRAGADRIISYFSEDIVRYLH
jgi:porphobilinogen synthase